MKIIKISHIWTSGIGHVVSSLIFNLIKNLSNKEIIFVKPSEADLLIIGCHNLDKISNKVYKGLSKRSSSS